MAIEANLEQSAIRVAEALHKFAKGRGWSPDDYRVFITVRPEWGTIHVQFLCNAFKGNEDEVLRQYDDIYDFLEQELEDDPSLYGAIGLVLLPFEGYGFQTRGPMLVPGEILIPDSLLNPGVKDFRGYY